MPRQASFCGLPVDPRNRGNRSRPSRDAGVWTIPAARMKAKRDHRVPLSGRALAILHDVQKLSDGPPKCGSLLNELLSGKACQQTNGV